MHFNFYFLKHLSKALDKKIGGSYVTSCFTQNKNELLIEFKKNQSLFYIKALLDGEISILTFPESFSRARKNSVDLFKEILHEKVIQVKQVANDRSFILMFDHGYQMVFKLHGKRSNIILCKDGSTNSLFKGNLLGDMTVSEKNLSKSPDQSDQNLIATNFDLKSLFPTFSKDVWSYLKECGFEKETDASKKLFIFKKVLVELEKPEFYISEVNQKLTVLPQNNKEYVRFSDPILAANTFGLHFHKNFYLTREKKLSLSPIRDRLKKGVNYLDKTSRKLTDLRNTRSYQELADILMANLHVSMESNQKQINLLDFYTNREISIKVNPNLSLQKNAENYYRKAKNQTKEIETLAKNIKSKELELENLNGLYKSIEQAQDIKAVRLITKSINVAQQSSGKTENPFIEKTIEGYQVLIGRNAKNNDVLTQKYAHKNDLWLHAKDVPGSHVVIRSRGGENYPKTLVEKAAQLAAYHSKRKTDTLCPVIFTLKKYVNKPKGFPPGMVKLLREEVVMVKPSKE